jgi:Leucine-rich repeat (LRR) protein
MQAKNSKMQKTFRNFSFLALNYKFCKVFALLLRNKNMNKIIGFLFALFAFPFLGFGQQSKLLDEKSLEKLPVFISLEDAMLQPTKVYKLNLSRMKLKAIPKEIYTFVNLQQLDLSYNDITEVPKEIGILKNLQKLDLTHNKIKELPATISLFKNLEEFLVGSNQLKTIPMGMAQLKKLLLLEVEENKIPEKEVAKLQKALPHCDIIYE